MGADWVAPETMISVAMQRNSLQNSLTHRNEHGLDPGFATQDNVLRTTQHMLPPRALNPAYINTAASTALFPRFNKGTNISGRRYVSGVTPADTLTMQYANGSLFAPKVERHDDPPAKPTETPTTNKTLAYIVLGAFVVVGGYLLIQYNR
jgi:hypothetical protein